MIMSMLKKLLFFISFLIFPLDAFGLTRVFGPDHYKWNVYERSWDIFYSTDADPLNSGSTYYIQNRNTLQSGATFYVSSGTVTNLAATTGTLTAIRWADGTVQVSSPQIVSGSTLPLPEGATNYLPNSLDVIFSSHIAKGAGSLHDSTGTLTTAINSTATTMTTQFEAAFSSISVLQIATGTLSAQTTYLALHYSNTNYATLDGGGATVNMVNSTATYILQGNATPYITINGSTQTKTGGLITHGSIRVAGGTGSSFNFQGGNGMYWDSGFGAFLNTTANTVININSDNDTDTGRYFAISSGATTATGGTERVRFTQAGSVGIGTNAPSSRLDISGGSITVRGTNAGLRVVNTGTDGSYSSFESTSNFQELNIKVSADQDSFLVFYENNVNKLIMKNSSSEDMMKIMGQQGQAIGIGATNGGSESVSLTVAPGNGFVGVGVTTASSLLEVAGGSVTIRGANSGLEIAGSTFSVSGTTGRVGVGTSDPSSRLDIAGGSITIRGTNAGLAIAGSTFTVSGATGKVGIGTGDPSSTLDINGGSLTIRGTNAGLAVGVKNFVVQTGGNVGIGESVPIALLTVAGKILSTGTAAELSVLDRTTPSIQHTLYGSGGVLRLYRNADVITHDGTSLSALLDTTTEAGNVYHDAITRKFSRGTSSRRYKDRIIPLVRDYKKILALAPKQYRNKEQCKKEIFDVATGSTTWEYDETCNKTSIGYIAEEVSEIPELKDDFVMYDGQGRIDALRYGNISIYLVELAKEQEARINQLETTVADLKRRLELLEAKP